MALFVMEPVIVVTALLSSALIAAAQQPTEWRPNIAEDNAAATLQDTTVFISNSLHLYSHGITASTPQRCHLDVQGSDAPTALGFAVKIYDEHSLAIESVQSGSAGEAAGLVPGLRLLGFAVNGESRMNSQGTRIRTPQDFSEFEATLHKGDRIKLAVYSEHLSSTSIKPLRQGSSIGYVEFTLPKEGSGHEDVDLRQIDPLSIFVRTNIVVFAGSSNGPFASELSTTPPTMIATPLTWSVAEPDIAKRVARALMHAALLCGGTKAVSPF